MITAAASPAATALVDAVLQIQDLWIESGWNGDSNGLFRAAEMDKETGVSFWVESTSGCDSLTSSWKIILSRANHEEIPGHFHIRVVQLDRRGNLTMEGQAMIILHEVDLVRGDSAFLCRMYLIDLLEKLGNALTSPLQQLIMLGFVARLKLHWGKHGHEHDSKNH